MKARIGPSAKLLLLFNTKQLRAVRTWADLNMLDHWAGTSLNLLELKSSMTGQFS